MFEKDDVVRVSGEGGLFRVVKVRANGDVDVYGGPGYKPGINTAHTLGHAMFRTFEAKRLCKAKR